MSASTLAPGVTVTGVAPLKSLEGVEPEEVNSIKRSAQAPVSLEKPVGDEEESEFGHFLTDESEPLPDEAAEVAVLSASAKRLF